MKIKKAVIPAAGWGTRFLPATKAIPKEMLPIVDRPIIQYVVEEVVNSGIEDIVIVTGANKRAIEDHFDRLLELEQHLQKQNKYEKLSQIQKIAQLANFIYIRQKGDKYGNAIPVLSAESVIGNEPFVVLWGDEFIAAKPPRLAQMLKAYEKYKGIMISAVRIKEKEDLSRYGIADVEKVDENIFKIKRIVEKPKPEEAPSNLASHGAYILPPEIFDTIKNLKPGKGKEYWLPEAINELNKKGVPVYACEIENGKYYDTGNKLEYLKTVIEFALERSEFSEDLKKYLKTLNL
ncbi:MAG: UTP--glucose-1-phosphate uridylyltransferase [Patescibacteria group bacterium]|nr:UTP--glucose-1-phosphate uridylyltransferase [Patescibacteria group bacterium]